MRVLHLEDTVMKHIAIKRVLNQLGIYDIFWVKNVEEGLTVIKEAQENGKMFDFIITDMHYPLSNGMPADSSAGDRFMESLMDKNIRIPVIVASSANEKREDAFGCVCVREPRNWEEELSQLVRKIH